MQVAGRKITAILEAKFLLAGNLENRKSQCLDRVDQPFLDLSRFSRRIEFGRRMTRLNLEWTTPGPAKPTEMSSTTECMS